MAERVCYHSITFVNRRLYAKIWWDWIGVLHIYPCHLSLTCLTATMSRRKPDPMCEGFDPIVLDQIRWIGGSDMLDCGSDTCSGWIGYVLRLDRIRLGWIGYHLSGLDTSVWIRYGVFWVLFISALPPCLVC